MKQAEVVPEDSWDDLLEELRRRKGCAIVLGATDSGKSSLVRHLIRRLVRRGISVSLVDSDVGQSSLGLPGTICMKVFAKPSDLRHFVYRRMSFLGAVNPAKIIPLVVSAASAMTASCRGLSHTVLVDTCGLVEGVLGKELQSEEIRSIRPEHIVALERGDELGHILQGIRGGEVRCLPVSDRAVPRTRAERASYRRRKLERYFGRGALFLHKLGHGEFPFFSRGRLKDLEWGGFEPGTVIGLNNGEDTLALGILREATVGRVSFVTPRKSLRRVNRIVLGDIAFSLADFSKTVEHVKIIGRDIHGLDKGKG